MAEIEVTPEQEDEIVIDNLRRIIDDDPNFFHKEDQDDWRKLVHAARVLLAYFEVQE